MFRHTGLGVPAMRPSRLVVLAAVAVLGATPGVARAHALIAQVTFTPAEVKVVAGYDDETPADGAKAAITTADGQPVASGVLDKTGSWAAPLPPPGRYVLVVVDAGHRDRKEFTVHAPAPEQPAAEVTHERSRLPKVAGIAVGLAVLLGGSLVYAVVRRRGARPAGGSLS